MDAVYRELNKARQRGERVALAVLVETKGSTPQKPGAKALFFSDGRIVGTLGGGCLEAEARTKALRTLDTGEVQTFRAVLDDDFGWDDGLICGGSVRIFIQPDPAAIPAIPPRQRSVLITDLRTGHRELRADDQPVMRVEDEKFYEPVLPNPTLIVCGAGHLGQTIAKLAAWCGFEVTVVDDRADLATHARFPEAREILVEDPVTAVRRFAFDADTYIALVTRGHRHDALILREVIHAPAGYIGMIGSKRKLRIIMEEFINEGLATAEDFQKIHSPMGVPIGAIRPEEIAVSVIAELIAVRRGIEAPSLSATRLFADRAKDSLASRR